MSPKVSGIVTLLRERFREEVLTDRYTTLITFTSHNCYGFDIYNGATKQEVIDTLKGVVKDLERSIDRSGSDDGLNNEMDLIDNS